MAVAAKGAVALKALWVQSQPTLQVIRKYALAELTPPKFSDLPAIRSGLNRLISGAKNGAWKNVSVRDGWLNTLVAVEVYCWFYVGECIGKRHIVGYKV